MTLLVRQVRWRNPFRMTRVPLLARLYRAGYSCQATAFGGFAMKKAYRAAYKAARRLPIRCIGVLEVDVNSETRRCQVDLRNTQFHWVYFPEYKHGGEPAVAALIDSLLGNRGIMYDVGSNWGYYSVLVASRAGFEGQVHAFEPYPPTYSDLRRVVSQLGLDSLIQCHPVGLSCLRRQARMASPDNLHSGLVTVGDWAEGLEVRLSPLDDLGLPDPWLMKVDAEDHEMEVLQGAEQMLRRAKPMIVFENMLTPRVPGSGPQVLQYLRELGYSIYYPAWVLRERGQIWLDHTGYNSQSDELVELALLPLEPTVRLILGPHVNLLACHGDRYASLRDFGFEKTVITPQTDIGMGRPPDNAL